MDIKRYNWPDCPYHGEAIIKMWGSLIDQQMNPTVKGVPLLMHPVNHNVAIIGATVSPLSSISPFPHFNLLFTVLRRAVILFLVVN